MPRRRTVKAETKVAPEKKATPRKQSIKPVAPAKTKHGIKETKEVILLISSFIYSMNHAMADGRFHWTDGLKFMGTLKVLPSAINGIENVPKEIGDLDKLEMDEIKAFILANLNLGSKDKESRAEKLIKMAFTVLQMIQEMSKG